MKPVLLYIIVCLVGAQVSQGQIRRVKNTKSELDFLLTNTGILFNNDAEAGLRWPRGSSDIYMFGAGFWFGAKKTLPPSAGSERWALVGSLDDSLIAICGNPTTTTVIVGTLDDSIYCRSESDKTWKTVSIPARKYSHPSLVTLPSGDELIAVDSGVFLGKDSGPWIQAAGTKGERILAVSSYGAIVASGQHGPAIFSILIPDASFKNWSICRTTTTKISAVTASIGSSNDNKNIAVSNNTLIWISTDFGVTWDSTAKPSAATIRAIAFSPVDGSMIIASDGIYQSNDKGKHWVSRNIGIGNALIQAFKAGGTGFIAATVNGLYFLPIDSMNNGGWINYSSGLPFVPIVAVDLDPSGKCHVTLANGSVYTQYIGGEFQSNLISVCELSFNPSTGAGWFAPGEQAVEKESADTIGKYFPYLSTSYDKKSGLPLIVDSITPPYRWPIWAKPEDAPAIKTNFRFGSALSKISERETASQTGAKPAFISDEDIVTVYNDADTSLNPLFKEGNNYPLGLTVEQRNYSWQFGTYRDVVFIRYLLKNTSADTLKECYFAPALDPDLGGGSGAANDNNIVITRADSVLVRSALGTEPSVQEFADNPSALNMAYQWSDPEGGKEYGVIGFAFVETPIVNAGKVISPDDSIALGGYGDGSLYPTHQLGLRTFRTWTINNDPQGDGARYSFISSGLQDHGTLKGDLRALLSTGPFDLLPGAAATITLAVGIVRPSMTDRQKNIDSLISLIAHAHRFFASKESIPGNPQATIIRNFGGSPDQAVSSKNRVSNIDLKVYPNPSSSLGILQYTLKEYSTISIAIYNESGQKSIQPLLEKKVAAGKHEVPLDLSMLPSGQYTCVVTCNGEPNAIPIVLSK